LYNIAIVEMLLVPLTICCLLN